MFYFTLRVHLLRRPSAEQPDENLKATLRTVIDDKQENS